MLRNDSANPTVFSKPCSFSSVIPGLSQSSRRPPEGRQCQADDSEACVARFAPAPCLSARPQEGGAHEVGGYLCKRSQQSARKQGNKRANRAANAACLRVLLPSGGHLATHGSGRGNGSPSEPQAQRVCCLRWPRKRGAKKAPRRVPSSFVWFVIAALQALQQHLEDFLILQYNQCNCLLGAVQIVE